MQRIAVVIVHDQAGARWLESRERQHRGKNDRGRTGIEALFDV